MFARKHYNLRTKSVFPLESTNPTYYACETPKMDQSDSLIVVSAVFAGVTVISFLLRSISRPPFTSKYGFDDALIIPAVEKTLLPVEPLMLQIGSDPDVSDAGDFIFHLQHPMFVSSFAQNKKYMVKC
jgi:hypothetical protein